MARKFWIGGNWKCNGSTSSIKDLAKGLNGAGHSLKDIDVVCCPTAVYIPLVLNELDKGKYQVASQNICHKGTGAFTGEVAISQLKDMGINVTLVGHSERREIFGESDALIGDKVEACQKEPEFQVCICIGESLEERENCKTMKVCARQLDACLPKITDWSRVVIAYEPVWAIGTGITATPAMAQGTHADIRKHIATKVSQEVADSVRIVYGGSLNDKNAKDLLSQRDIDGGLIGGAALDATKFRTIIDTALAQK